MEESKSNFLLSIGILQFSAKIHQTHSGSFNFKLTKDLHLTLKNLKYYEPDIFNEAFSTVSKYVLFKIFEFLKDDYYFS